MDRAATSSRALSQVLGTFARQKVIYMNSSMTFEAPWTLSSETMAAATLEAVSQTRTAAVAEWYRYRIVACLVMSSSPKPLKTHRVGQRCTINLSRAETSSRCRALRNPTFQQDNARPHVAGIVRTFLDTKNVRLLPWPAHSSDLSPTENVWFMVAERLACHHTSLTTVDEL
ncbi:uncharacterized protein TNCV_3396481 [Trichonephila clavipes]|nr:uncharacterized protein TNCV_3396481 [Trichonephila clavipes]